MYRFGWMFVWVGELEYQYDGCQVLVNPSRYLEYVLYVDSVRV
jgi:hypothetical protein